jgi:hypothetical protein
MLYVIGANVFVDALAAGAQGLFTAHNAKGLGYAISQDDELKTVQVGHLYAALKAALKAINLSTVQVSL